MVLKIEKEYTTKTGEVKALQNAKMKVMGKLMERDEEKSFVILADSITVYETGLYPSYKLYVTLDDGVQSEAFNLDLSNQAYKEINGLNFQKGDILKIKKAYFTSEKNGAEMPIIKAEITNREVTRTHNSNENVKVSDPKQVIFPVEVSQYTEMFDKSIQANPRPVTLHDFIATYFRLEANKLPVIDVLVEEYNNRFSSEVKEEVKKDKGVKKDEPVKPTKSGSKE